MECVSRKLIEIDIDVVRVVSYLGGDEQLYLSICRKYLEDQNVKLLQEAFAREDYAAAEFYIHTLKGIAANLGFIRLDALCKNILEDLRMNEFNNIPIYFIDLYEEHKRIVSVLNEN